MISIEGRLYIPEGARDPRSIVPDDVVFETASRLELLTASKRGIDPMCGVGTIPRVVSENGGSCDGIDVDRSQIAVARRVVPDAISIVRGDCTKLTPSESYDYAYTSLPFSWFNGELIVDPIYAKTFKRLLINTGVLIIDSVNTVQRDGTTWNVADKQTQYFSDNGFNLVDRLEFLAQNPAIPEPQSTEIIFSMTSS